MHAAVHQSAAGRQHRLKFRIDGKKNARRLALALGAIVDLEQSVLLALKEVGAELPRRTVVEMRAALRLLAHGPNGELR
jgi:hypothetical protein